MIQKPKNVLMIFDQGPEEQFWFFYFPNVSDEDWSKLSRVHNKFINQEDITPEVEQTIYDYTLYDPEYSHYRQSEVFDDYPNFKGSSSTFVNLKMDGDTTIIHTGILP